MDPALRARIEEFKQSHLVAFWPELDSAQRAALAEQLAQVDWELMSRLFRERSEQKEIAEQAWRAEPPPAAADLLPTTAQRAEVLEAGCAALAAGQVAFILVAGGQGSRLGYSLPKGMLPLGPLSQRTLFEIILNSVHAWRLRCGGAIPVCIMTSPATHEATVRYFNEHQYLGFEPDDVMIFCQATLPAVDASSGQLLLAEKHQLALSPDGHGGILAALQRGGVLARLRERGIETCFYGQVDNPLLQVCDPWTLGAHLLSGSEMTTQVIRKTDPLQRVGNVVAVDGRVQIIEYSDLPAEVARQRNPDGSLKLWAGSIAVHVFQRTFLERCAGLATALPYHAALKRVPHIDRDGRRVAPSTNNALKFERFIFDLLPQAQRPVVLEIDAAAGFAAVKNEAGAASETVETAQRAMVRRHQDWLRQCGVTVPDSVDVEICPRFALDPAELRGRIAGWGAVTEPTFFQTAPAGAAEDSRPASATLDRKGLP